MTTTFVAIRNGQEVEVELRWSISGSVSRWKEWHPYGLGHAAEDMAEAHVNDVELVDQIWPDGHQDQELTDAEFRKARRETLKTARDAPFEHVSD